ncbi:hypothetical protein BABINDRAFT_37580 [Babjeviella inositovora NRRL Y-12698]|uniref:Uncharacterized protein n=1 Tax=Babjeviella inositovora NRRL Y-12698 TaxID=984486 RepID=A0A1E3QPN4_9ASCO|nr:uncharacterized protein BABINDRAFT_37580 [Babjeviella inositovora NRRL Y-12698]ODQ79610.1 hypothetical protein BABINDRAFT_37580 [Babjeviella inositovora NRRL Y-12698]
MIQVDSTTVTITKNPYHYTDAKGGTVLTKPLTWEQLRTIIATNTLQNLGRSLSQLQEYRAFRETLAAQNIDFFGQVLEKLHWSQDEVDAVRASKPQLFTPADDIVILKNDFPYSFDPEITHLLVWCKAEIPTDPKSTIGDMSPETRARINRWMDVCFVQNPKLQIPWKNLCWFKNWAALQSIPKLAHIHLMIRGLKPEQLEMILKDKESLVMLHEE